MKLSILLWTALQLIPSAQAQSNGRFSEYCLVGGHPTLAGIRITRSVNPSPYAAQPQGVLSVRREDGTFLGLAEYTGITPSAAPFLGATDALPSQITIIGDTAATREVHEERCFEGFRYRFRRLAVVVGADSRNVSLDPRLFPGTELAMDCFRDELSFRPFECAP